MHAQMSGMEKARRVWASRLQGHLRTQGYEDADGDSLKPFMYIHAGTVDWSPSVNSSLQEERAPFHVNKDRQETLRDSWGL